MKLIHNTIIVLFLLNKSLAQDITPKPQYKVIELGIVTPIYFSSSKYDIVKKIKILNDDLGTVSFLDGNFTATIDDIFYRLEPETYNIGISLIKDRGGRIIGMTKKYDKTHLIGLDNQIYKFEYLANGQTILTKLMDDESIVQLPTNKKMTIEGQGIKMEVFHNLNTIPAILIPIILNTRKIDKKISGKVMGGLLSSAALLAIRILIDTNTR
jgi:hypothetical protein